MGWAMGIPNDDSVLTANISGVTSLGVSLQGISDLTGIEDFSALTYLNCNSNSLLTLNLSQNFSSSTAILCRKQSYKS